MSNYVAYQNLEGWRRGLLCGSCRAPAALFLLIISCCTYSFSGLSSKVDTIAVPVFGNKTTRYGIEEVLTRKVIEAFIADNRVKVVDRSGAKSIILAEVVAFRRDPFSYDEREQVKEYRVEISVEMSYESLPDGEALWEGRVNEWGNYFAATENEENGIERAASKLAQEVLRRILEQW